MSIKKCKLMLTGEKPFSYIYKLMEMKLFSTFQNSGQYHGMAAQHSVVGTSKNKLGISRKE